MKQIKYIIILCILVQLIAMQHVFAQGFRTTFGKNRIQTKDYTWSFIRNDKQDVYYYNSGKDLASFVAEQADFHIDEIESFFDYRLDDKITFLLYNSKLDYNESNMFLERDAYNIGGTTKIIGKSCFIYYPGNHFEFIKNIRQGIAQVLLNDILYGGSLQDRIQNSALLSLPEWYVNGLVNHVSKGWDSEADSKLRNGLLSGKMKKMAALSAEQKDLVSQSLWMYIDRRYGHESVSNILYVSRVNKSIESGFLYVLGKTLTDVYDEWYQFTYYKYLEEQNSLDQFENQVELPKKWTKGRLVSHFAPSKDGDVIAISTNKMGKTRLYLYWPLTGKKQRVMSFGYKSAVKEIDESYPVFCWDSKRFMLHYIYEKNGSPRYVQYDVATDKKVRVEPLTQIQKVYSMSMSPDGRNIAISGFKNGRTDIMILDAHTAFVRSITNDDYDDMNPIFINDGKSIVFSSNRPDERFKAIKKFENNFDFAPSFDLFQYNIKEKATKFIKLTHTDGLNETDPCILNDSLIGFIQDAKGPRNLGVLKRLRNFQELQLIRKKKNNLIGDDDTLYFKNVKDYIEYKHGLNDSDLANISKLDTQSVFLDSSELYKLSNFGENIGQYYVGNNGKIRHLGYYKNAFGVYEFPLPEDLFAYPLSSNGRFSFMDKLEPKEKKSAYTSEQVPEEEVVEDSFRYYFQTGFEDLDNVEIEPEKLKKQAEKNKTDLVRGGRNLSTTKKKAGFYFVSFYPDELVTQLDIGNFNTAYLPYKNGENYITFPGLNGLSRLAISDRFKDYRIEGGFRPTLNLSGADYFIKYQNLKNRWDKELFFFRSGNKKISDTSSVRNVLQEARITYKYPFSEISAISFEGFLREDVYARLGSNRDDLESEDQKDYWVGGKASFTYDNTMPDGTNILYGMRFKFYYENFNLIGQNQSLHIVGGDFRHYLKIYRNLILANRVAFATSLGRQKVVYFMGGTENWLIPEFNNEINVDESIDYVYKAAAVNLRGFSQNIRNGASYALSNSELRLPIMRFFSNKPLKSAFLENLQFIGFADAGVAFNGFTPGSEENVFNKKIFDADPVRVERWSLRKPLVAGYGFGVRSNILGYFVRLDWAWGVEAGIEPSRTFYISLGTDF